MGEFHATREAGAIHRGRGEIIEAMKLQAIELARFYNTNIQVQFDVNEKNRTAKIRITEVL